MNQKIKKILFLLVILIGSIGWLMIGYKMGRDQKEIIVEKPILIPVELDNPTLIETSIENVSQKYGIKKEVLKAIIKCEGGTVFGWSKTNDGGLFQINWKTAQQYGARSLKDIIDPRYSTELAAQILLKEGLKPWITRDCIEKELIKITLDERDTN